MAQTNWDAKHYDQQHGFVPQYGLVLVDLLNPQAGERVLDLGCGTGDLTAEIAKRGAEVVGIDQSENMITQAAQKFPSVTFKIANGENFHFAQPFDAVFSNAALHWMMHPEKVIHCVADALKLGGRFVFEMGGFGNLQQLLKAIDEAAREMSLPTVKLQNYYPTVEAHTDLLIAQGFEVQQAELIERPTQLEGEKGLRHWVQMFRQEQLAAIDKSQHEVFYRILEAIARPHLCHNNHWWADYVRLRVVGEM